MKQVRTLYGKLSVDTRIKIRSWMPRGFLRWYAHRNTDAYLISYPKCGRTWLRLMIGRAMTQHYHLPESEDNLLLRWQERPHPSAPRIAVVHDDRPMLKAPYELQQSKARYRDKSVIFLVRDPRDVIISSYFEMKKRGRLFGDNPYEERQAVFEGSLVEFIEQPQGGFDTILQYYNIWANNRQVPKAFLLVRYEDMRANVQSELRRVLDFLGLQAISDQTVAEAVQYASFENMRKMEAERHFQSGILKPADINDGESYKTRKGKVHGYLEYLDKDEIEKLNRKTIDDLSSIYGYPYTSSSEV